MKVNVKFSSFDEAIESVKKDVTELRNFLKRTKTKSDIKKICNAYCAETLEQKNEILMRGMGVWKTTDDSEQERYHTLCISNLDHDWEYMCK